MSIGTEIEVRFDGRRIPNSQVLEWESRRARKNLRKLGVAVPTGDVEVLRAALLEARTRVGRAGIERLLAREIRWSDRVTGVVARLSGRRRALSQVELFVPAAAADQLPAWYAERCEADDEKVFLSACPDHHIFRPTTQPGGQEVWETPGGLPLALRFFVELGSTEGVLTAADPSYPAQLVASVRLADGTLFAGIRHQLRDEDGGVRVLLTVEFPWLIGPFAPAAHRWHLACEFSNWLRAAARNDRSPI